MDFTTVLRYILSIAGGWLIGKSVGIFGAPVTITGEVWQLVTGLLMSALAIYLSWKAKQVDIEQVQGFLRHLGATLGTILVATGRVTLEQLGTWIELILALSPLLYSWLTGKKNAALKRGTISPRQLASPGLKKAA